MNLALGEAASLDDDGRMRWRWGSIVSWRLRFERASESVEGAHRSPTCNFLTGLLTLPRWLMKFAGPDVKGLADAPLRCYSQPEDLDAYTASPLS